MWAGDTIQKYRRVVKRCEQLSRLDAPGDSDWQRSRAIVTLDHHQVALSQLEFFSIDRRDVEEVRRSQSLVWRSHRHCAGVELVQSSSSHEQERKFFVDLFFRRAI